MFHLNTRSVRNKLDYISDITDSFNILCFSETHLDNSIQSEALMIYGYDTPIRKDRTCNGGGVMVYVSNLLRYKRREDLEDPILETIWIEIKLRSFNILLCCFYRSDFNVSQSTFINELQSSIETALDYTQYVILTGDINIDFINLSNNQLRDCLSLFSLTNVITEPTRISANSTTLIDPVLVTDACCVLDSGTLSVDEQISDHKATYLSVKIPLRLSNCYYREVWNYKNADYDLLNELIDTYDWNLAINNSLTVDESCKKFTNIFLDFCKRCIPSKKVLIRPNDKPWFTSELRYNIRLRDRLRNRAFQTGKISDLNRYKKQRNHVNNMKKYAKENFDNNLEDIVLNAEYGNKTFWQLMGRFMGKNNTCSIIPPLKKTDENYAFDDDEKVTVLNDYFCSISSIDDAYIALPYFENRTESSIENISITQSEVTDILSNLKVNKASGPDGISHRMLKYTSHTVAKPLCYLFNMSLQQRSFPSLWKSADVMPIFKKGDKSIVSNYRPISLISCVGKSFERIVFKNVYNHLLTNSLIYKYQSGFLPGHSTVHHLIEAIHHTCLALENHEINCQIYCDISKAFDRVWHRGLILKLDNYGIKGELLEWFQNYLINRNQRVSFNGVSSEYKSITAGVPQGSVLGPLLFLLYINDISDELTSLARLFADDTFLSFSSVDPMEIKYTMNQDLSKLNDWAKKWLVTFNPSKTEVMFISNIYFDENIELFMDDAVLQIVNTHKHLGVVLSSNHKWTNHIENLIKTATKQISFLRKIKYKFSSQTLNKLYCVYIRPLLEYASEVWDGCSQIDSDRLEQVQLNAARIVTGLPMFASLNSLYLETGWETLSERRKIKKLSLMYKIVNNDAPPYLQELLPNTVMNTSNYNLRNSQNFDIPFSRLCSFESSFFPSTLRLWNNLDLQKRNSESLSIFKRSIRNIPYKSPCYLFVGERKYNVLLTRIRHSCSSLHADLYRVNIIQSPACDCGANIENTKHYFFECNLYNEQRNALFLSLNTVPNISLDLLVNGSSDFTEETNTTIITSVLKFIKDSGRFRQEP
ncbi:MAG: reverse transcriptase family protein [Candidatus Thiodiazotropha sp.]